MEIDESSLVGVDAGTLDQLNSTDFVQQNEAGSVDSAMIENVFRQVPMPLASFIDCQTDSGAFLDFSSGVDPIADFSPVHPTTDGLGFTIRFDDTGGSQDQSSEICSQVTLPNDYADGGSIYFSIRASKDGHAGIDERLQTAGSLNGAPPVAGDFELTTAAASTAYLSPMLGASAAQPGDSMGLSLNINPSSGNIDDAVDIQSVALMYAAVQ